METRDKSKLLKTITDWRVFDMLYNDEYCALLMKYWREVRLMDWSNNINFGFITKNIRNI